MVIKIIRSSVKRNPNAGATTSWMRGHREAAFMFPDRGRIPANLLDKVEITSWADAEKPEDGVRQRGFITNPDDAALFYGIQGIHISVDNGRQAFHHAPEPEFLFEYENPAIICEKCGTAFPVKEIDNDVIDDGDGGETFIDQVCPHCYAYDTFGEIEYEEIGDVVKELERQDSNL